MQVAAIPTILRDFPLQVPPTGAPALLVLPFLLVPPLLGMRRLPARVPGSAGAGAAAARLRPGDPSARVYGWSRRSLFSGGTVPAGRLADDRGWPARRSAPSLAPLLLEASEERRIHDLFARFVPEKVVDQVVANADEDLRLGGEQREATVLFSDLRGFTDFLGVAPAGLAVIEILNDYLGEMTDAILDAGGTLVAYMGDGIMAVFAAPLDQADHADRALRAARDMLDPARPVQRARGAGRAGPVPDGVGLNTGPVISGNVGSERRLEYTTIGDTVNTASRIEGMTKEAPYWLLMAESTVERSLRAPVDIEFHAALPIRGRSDPVRLWGVRSPVAPDPSAPGGPERRAGRGRRRDRHTLAESRAALRRALMLGPRARSACVGRSSRLPRWLQRLVDIGALPSDSASCGAQGRAGPVLDAHGGLACVWVVTYAVLGLWLSAAIPFAYQLASAASIATFARTRRYVLFRQSQLVLTLLLPFALQWSLGGFENSSAVCLWGFTSPLGALLFVGARQAVPWFLAFAALVASPPRSTRARRRRARHPAGCRDGVLRAEPAGRLRDGVRRCWSTSSARASGRWPNLSTGLELEQAKSERLLLNVLPAPIAARLKEHEEVIADDFAGVTVLFADIVGFTPLAERLPAAEVVVAARRGVRALGTRSPPGHGVEKIKTIGDAYMVAGGIPLPRADHAEAIADMALAMGPELAAAPRRRACRSQVRIGIDSGPVVAGVIGRAKFSYDLWGDTVNTASRMESNALPGTIQVTERAYERLRQRFDLRRAARSR